MNVAIVYIYSNSFQKVDEEEYGGMSEILKEGLMTSFSSFLVRGSLYASFLADQGRGYNHICCGILCILYKWKMDSVYKATTTTVLVLLAVLPIK